MIIFELTWLEFKCLPYKFLSLFIQFSIFDLLLNLYNFFNTVLNLRLCQSIFDRIWFQRNLWQCTWLYNSMGSLLIASKVSSVLDLNNRFLILLKIKLRNSWLFLLTKHALELFEAYFAVMSNIMDSNQFTNFLQIYIQFMIECPLKENYNFIFAKLYSPNN